jgi:ABC-type transport system substrate-binding protein
MADERIGYTADPKQNERNHALRCAIRKGFSWPERIKRFYNGIGEAYPGFIVPGLDGYDPNMSKESITYDVAAAKKLLADNGWTPANLPVFEYSGVASVRDKQFYEQFRGWMVKIGFPKEKIKRVDFATFGDFSKAQKEKKLMAIAMGWGIDYPDSENLLQMFYSPNGSPGSNASNYKNPAFDKLFEQSMAMQPGPDRTAIYKKLNQMIVDDCVAISGFSRTTLLTWHKNMIAYPTRNTVSNIFKYVDVK